MCFCLNRQLKSDEKVEMVNLIWGSCSNAAVILNSANAILNYQDSMTMRCSAEHWNKIIKNMTWSQNFNFKIIHCLLNQNKRWCHSF